MSVHDLVVDVGNTRVKWGRCSEQGISDSVALPADAPEEWQRQLERWDLRGQLHWVLAGVHPHRRDTLAGWARQRGDTVTVLDDWQRLPLRLLVDHPQRVGIDRLLDAVAANSRRRPGTPAAVIDAGSAITVDWLDVDGAFTGGAILPGLRLMARALHEHTALLPLVEVPVAPPPLPGASTPTAITAGIYWAAAGGVLALIRQLAAQTSVRPDVFLTGGDAPALHPALSADVHLWPAMTLEGIRLTI